MRGLSQLDMALAAGYKSQADISRIERDEQWPDGERMEAIAKALDCSASDLFRYAETEFDRNEAREERALERPVISYGTDTETPTLDRSLRAVEFELPAVDPKTQALLAVEVYKSDVAQRNTDRIVGAINGLTMAIEQLKGEP
jgi:transcriptional regulator with XRE-family HTH domain